MGCERWGAWECAERVWECAERVAERERDFFIDNLLVRIHMIIVMIRWTGLAPWEFEFPFPGSRVACCAIRVGGCMC